MSETNGNTLGMGPSLFRWANFGMVGIMVVMLGYMCRKADKMEDRVDAATERAFRMVQDERRANAEVIDALRSEMAGVRADLRDLTAEIKRIRGEQ